MNKKIVSLVGRPNVGKSTLFNRLITRLSAKAIVHDQPGVTRDRKYGEASIGGAEFTVIDTPGLEESGRGQLEHRMMQQTKQAIEESDLVCLIVDGRAGITPADKFFANFIRQLHKNYVLLVNKCEQKFDFDAEYYKLGFDEPVAISAEHGLGIADMYDAIFGKLKNIAGEYTLEQDNPFTTDSIQIAVVGRPNAVKSTFINAILGTERLLSGPEAGITRESIAVEWVYKDKPMKLIDTAGLRRKNAITQNLEKLSASDTIHSIKFANVVVLMIDATCPLEQQDLTIAEYVLQEGRSLVIAVNKWDLIKDKQAFKEEINYRMSVSLSQAKGAQVVFISALNYSNVNQVLDACIETYALWNKKVPTHKLNDWLIVTTESHPLPLQKNGRRVRIKYMTQVKTRPPTFKLFTNNPTAITDSYKKFLISRIREDFDFPGVPLRLMFTKSNNPYK